MASYYVGIKSLVLIRRHKFDAIYSCYYDTYSNVKGFTLQLIERSYNWKATDENMISLEKYSKDVI